MENIDLPKPQTDLPLPEKELPAYTGGGKFSFLKNKFFILFVFISFLLAFLIGGIILGQNYSDQKKIKLINDFETCATAGYPITQSYPATCKTPDGRSFTQELTEEEKENLDLQSSTADWKTYAGNGFSFKYPSNWSVDSSKSDSIIIGPLSTINHIGQTVPEYVSSYITLNIKDSIPNTDLIKYSKIDSSLGAVWENINIDNLTGYTVDHGGCQSGTCRDVFFQKNSKIYNFFEQNQLNELDQILSTFTFAPLSASKFTDSLNEDTSISMPTTATQVNGAGLSEIKYTLPLNWRAEISNFALSFYPQDRGGYLTIKISDYDGTTGRREYYCKITNYCIPSSTFTSTQIGNISGYKADALDNSGGGAEYFGAKGNKFYIISTYNPPSPNEYEKNYQNVLNSLVF